METALEKLEEYVLDEDRIVTIASFAKDVNISLRDAKQILKNFVEKHRSSGKVHATYILNGITKKDKQNYVAIVKSTDLAEKKELFDENVTETVFSVQKSDNIDFSLIALADPVNEKLNEEPLLGSIISKNCTKRVIKKRVLPSTPATQSKPSIFEKQSSTKSDDSIKSEKNGSDEHVSKLEPKPKSSQGGIANMFNKMSQNRDESKPKQEKSNALEKSKPKNAGISGFFTKMSSNSEINGKKESKSEEKIVLPKKEKCSPKAEKESYSKNKNDLFDSDDSNEEVEKMMMQMNEEVAKANTKKFNKKKEDKKPVKKRKAKNSDEDSQSNKKRKRIVVAEDSDSDDIFASDKEDKKLSDSDEEPKEEVKKPLPPKNKKRKAVDKTYQDEEGFIVTKTEYVYETASEDEHEEPPKKAMPEPKAKPNFISKKSNSSNSDMDVDGTPQKNKGGKKGAKKSTTNQPTLMNFFTKK